MKTIWGNELANEVKDTIRSEVDQIKAEGKRLPVLAVVLVGDNPASQSYVQSKANACINVGMENRTITLDGNISQEELLDTVKKLNADEIYCLLMGCYFHDTGMGIRKKDYDEFSQKIDFGNYFETHSRKNIPDIIRTFHNEFSGLFLEKYSDLFEIPSAEHLYAIIQISRGHRKTDLTDEKEYPIALPVLGGNTICLPYLSALIRLADEIDVAAGRNLSFLYETSSLTNEKDIIEFGKHEAIKEVAVSDQEFVLIIDTDDETVYNNIRKMSLKMQKTVDECCAAVTGRTPYVITQKAIKLKRIKG